MANQVYRVMFEDDLQLHKQGKPVDTLLEFAAPSAGAAAGLYTKAIMDALAERVRTGKAPAGKAWLAEPWLTEAGDTLHIVVVTPDGQPVYFFAKAVLQVTVQHNPTPTEI